MGQQSTDWGPEFLKSRLAQGHWELVAEPERNLSHLTLRPVPAPPQPVAAMDIGRLSLPQLL